jgi:hypothetical protein
MFAMKWMVGKSKVVPVTVGVAALLIGLAMSFIPSVYAYSQDPTFFLTNTGSSTGGGLQVSNSGLGGSQVVAMGTTTFSFTATSGASGAGSWTKTGVGTDNFILYLSGSSLSGYLGSIVLDLTFSTTSLGTDSGTASVTGTGGGGQYTFTIPSAISGLVPSSDVLTITVHCTQSGSVQAAFCAGLDLGWAGSTGSATNSNAQIPQGAPEFGVSSVLVGAVGLLGVALLRRGKMNSVPSLSA